MTSRSTALLAAIGFAAVAASPAYAFRGGGGSGGGSHSEPAGGAFMSSYTYPGSTGLAIGSKPRSVDIPQNGYVRPDLYVPGYRGGPFPGGAANAERYRYR